MRTACGAHYPVADICLPALTWMLNSSPASRDGRRKPSVSTLGKPSIEPGVPRGRHSSARASARALSETRPPSIHPDSLNPTNYGCETPAALYLIATNELVNTHGECKNSLPLGTAIAPDHASPQFKTESRESRRAEFHNQE